MLAALLSSTRRLRLFVFDVSSRARALSSKRPSVLPPLGGCPASCPDTYRLTHDHRHVRNWASSEIIFLTLLRNNFFRLTPNFPNACLQRALVASSSALECERMLSLLKET